ncbi:unnamed protein product [Peniophora sp. CBMAI 1063]|nr:unnamed protein product [Peniophora sp. CBMAI 1063]
MGCHATSIDSDSFLLPPIIGLSVMDDEEDLVVDETYGEHAPKVLTSNLLTAVQFRALEPLVTDYVTLDGQEKNDFVLKAFCDIWDGEEIQWDLPQLWPSKTSNRRFHVVKQAVKNFFKEQGRIRDVVVQPLRKGSNKLDWDPLSVCSDVYGHIAAQMVHEVAGIQHGHQYWLRKYNKANTALYYSLSDGQRTQVEFLANEWNKNGLPKEMKKRKFLRSAKREMFNQAVKNLKLYGIYTWFLYVPEPTVSVPAKFLDFSKELGLGEKRFDPDHTPMKDTLVRLKGFVNDPVGTGEVQAKQTKKTKHAMDEMKGYVIHADDYHNRNCVILRKGAYRSDLLRREAKCAVYYIFNIAHANLSPYHGQELETPWSDIGRTDTDGNGVLIDRKYFPPNFVMKPPYHLSIEECLQLLNWLFDIGHIEFHHWKRCNGKPQVPVPENERFWAEHPGDPTDVAFIRARDKALAAAPGPIPDAGVQVDNTSRGQTPSASVSASVFASVSASGSASVNARVSGPAPPSGPASMHHHPMPITLNPASTLGLSSTIQSQLPRQLAGLLGSLTTSRFGSSKSINIHNTQAWDVDRLAGAPIYVEIPDPDDLVVSHAEVGGLVVPAGVPFNVEAQAQWCFAFTECHGDSLLFPAGLFQRCVTFLAELPLVRNHNYSTSSFRNGRRAPALPPAVSWETDTFDGLTQPAVRASVIAYVLARPWCFMHNGESLFSGIQMAWCFLLALCLLSCSGPYPHEESQRLSAEFKQLLKEFRDYLRDMSTRHEYPGIAPSMKYATSQSRQQYLYSVFWLNNDLIDILSEVEKLPTLHPPNPCTFATVQSFPSWQSLRCGLPVAMHADAQIVDKLIAFIGEKGNLVNPDSGTPIDREAALLHLLGIACIIADIENFEQGYHDATRQLSTSNLRGKTAVVADHLLSWAQSTLEVLRLLPNGQQSDFPDIDDILPDLDATYHPGRMPARASDPNTAAAPAPASALPTAHLPAPATESASVSLSVSATASALPSRTSTVPPPSSVGGPASPWSLSGSLGGLVGLPATRMPSRASSAAPHNDHTYAGLASSSLRDDSVLDYYVNHAQRGPITASQEAQQLAFAFHQRTQDRALENRRVRDASRLENLARYGSKVKPSKPPVPRATANLELPPTLDVLVSYGDSDADETPAPVGVVKRKRAPMYQPLAKGPTPALSTKTVKNTAAPTRTRKRLKKDKRPKPSDRKRAEEPSSDESSDDHYVNSSLSDAVDGDAGVAGTGAGGADGAASVATRTRGSQHAKKVTSRFHGSGPPTHPPPSVDDAGAYERRPVSKKRRVEVSLNPVTASEPPPKSSRPKPRMVRKKVPKQPLPSAPDLS